jgi:hypothetical protein
MRWGLWVVVVSVPLALGVEALLRRLILPPDFETLRGLWGASLTPWVWGLVPVAVVVDVSAFRLHRHLRARAARTEPALGADQLAWKRFEALMIAASVAQTPALVAIFGTMLGASLPSVVGVVAVSTAGVLALGAQLGSGSPPRRAPPPSVGSGSEQA